MSICRSIDGDRGILFPERLVKTSLFSVFTAYNACHLTRVIFL